MRISDWSSDVCSSDLLAEGFVRDQRITANGLLDRVAVAVFVQIVQRPELQASHRDELPAVVEAVVIEVDQGNAVDRQGRRQHEIGRASCRERVCQYV